MKIKDIRLVVYDFDGVLTDNKVVVREDGLETVVVNRSDGLAIDMLRRAGMRQVIFTTEKNKVAETRARKLGIPIECGLGDKRSALTAYCKKEKIPLKNVLYIGNDLNDLDAMKIVGYPVCPSDAYQEIRDISKIVLRSRGGEGVARELMSCLITKGTRNEKNS